MKIPLKKPVPHEEGFINFVEVPDYLQVGHRKAYARYKDRPEEEAGIAMCAAICGLSEEIFDRISLEDFEAITKAVQKLFEETDRKKPRGTRKK